MRVSTTAATPDSITRVTDTSQIAPGPVVVKVTDLHKSFGDLHVLRGLKLEVKENQFVALLGRSGGGKSTFLRVLEGLDQQFTGEVRVAPERAVVFQEPRLLPWRNVWQNVVLGVPGNADTMRETALAALVEVGLECKAENWPATLSGGEAQRVGLARALVRQPKLLLLDEPFGALDALTRLKMHAELDRLVRQHRPGVILVTHDVAEALTLADRILVLDSGTIVLDQQITADQRQHPDQLDSLRRMTLAALGVDNAQ